MDGCKKQIRENVLVHRGVSHAPYRYEQQNLLDYSRHGVATPCLRRARGG